MSGEGAGVGRDECPTATERETEKQTDRETERGPVMSRVCVCWRVPIQQIVKS